MNETDSGVGDPSASGRFRSRGRLLMVGAVMVAVAVGISVLMFIHYLPDLKRFVVDFRQSEIEATVHETNGDNSEYLAHVASLQAMNYVFFIVGHIRELNGNAEGDSGATIDAFSSLTNQISPQRVIFAGDTIVDGGEEQLGYIEDVLKPMFAPELMFALGNHELESTEYFENQLFERLFVAPNWYEDVSGTRVVMINSVTPGQNAGFTESDMIFLDRVLDNSYKRAIIITHNPAWLPDELSELANSANKFSGVDASIWLEEIILLLVERGVDVVFAGDAGFASRSTYVTICGIRHYLTGWAARSGAEVLGVREDKNSLVIDRIDLSAIEEGVLPVSEIEFEPQPVCSR